MRIAVLTTNEPLHHPAFFARFLEARAKDTVGLFICHPLDAEGRPRSSWWMFRRYVGAFGWRNGLRLAWRVAVAATKNALGIGRRRGRFHSIEAVARHYGVPAEPVANVNAPAFLERLRGLGADLVLSVSCPQVFREDLVNLPRLGCLNIHGADLPAYRGLLPSFWMLANDEREAGVTIFYVGAGIDTGDVLGKRRFPIEPGDTLHSFLVRAKQEACGLALEALERIEKGTATRTPLSGEGSYFKWPTREAYRRFRKAGRRLW